MFPPCFHSELTASTIQAHTLNCVCDVFIHTQVQIGVCVCVWVWVSCLVTADCGWNSAALWAADLRPVHTSIHISCYPGAALDLASLARQLSSCMDYSGADWERCQEEETIPTWAGSNRLQGPAQAHVSPVCVSAKTVMENLGIENRMRAKKRNISIELFALY